MATIPESTIEEIKARTDIADLISSYGIDVKRAGSSLKACCPFHSEKTPSFHINAAKGFYHCFGCGESGDAIKFVQRQEGLSFMDAVKKLAGMCGVKIEQREDPEAGRRARLCALMGDLAMFYRRCLLKMREAQAAREYLEKRDLGGQVQEDFLIGYAPNGSSAIEKWAAKYGYSMEEAEAAGVVKAPDRPGASRYHRFSGRLMFPIRDRQGRVVAFSGRLLEERKNTGKYVNSPDTPIFKKSNVLFGYDRAAAHIARSPHREAIVCEGQIDTIRLHANGFPVAVAAQGTAFTDEHARLLKRVADAAVLVFDDDDAGHKATIRTAAVLLAAEIPVRVVSLPDGDDPDSFLRTKGADAFRALLGDAESIMSFQCRTERAKERDPGSIDAVARVSKAVLATLAACPNAVLRASLCGEAARLLGLPPAALAEELSKAKAAPRPHRQAGRTAGESQWQEPPPAPPGDGGAGFGPGEDAAAAAPPPRREMAFMAFLLANEQNAAVDAAVGEFLPRAVFASDFTWHFVQAWRAGAATGEDRLAPFAASLPPAERRWFDEIPPAVGRQAASSLPATDIIQDYVRSLWCDRLRRLRGALPAGSDAGTDARRLEISADLKRLNMVKWSDVKEMARRFTREGEH